MITVDFKRLGLSDPGRVNDLRILDIGCGSGRHACEASRFGNVMVLGADIGFENVVEARQKLVLQEDLGECRGRWEIMVSEMTRLPFRDEYFDIVICSEVLEHIRNHKPAIDEIARVLKHGKTLAVSVPRHLPERICQALSEKYRNAEGGHVRIYDKRKLINLLESSGFRKKAMHYAHALHTPYWWLKCLVGPDRDDSALVNMYHRLLVWDMMKQPKITRFLEKILNPVIGKSIVIYSVKK